MSDSIRAALEEAAKTYCHLEVRCTCKGPERCFNSAIPKAKTAEAIAVFLRALPIVLDREFHLPDEWAGHPYPNFNALARAVLAFSDSSKDSSS
jgi:hypothetical protein